MILWANVDVNKWNLKRRIATKKGIDKDRVSVLISTVEEMAKAQGKMVGDLLREMGYRRDGERAFKV